LVRFSEGLGLVDVVGTSVLKMIRAIHPNSSSKHQGSKKYRKEIE